MQKSYEVGQIVNIGIYIGFHNQEFRKTTAEIEKIDGPIITIRIAMTTGYRRMFGFAEDLWKLEKLYIEN